MYYGSMPVIDCPLCSTMNNSRRRECRYCSCPLTNVCSDEDCLEPNRPEARYCKRCGSPTAFLEFGVFDPKVREETAALARSCYARYGDPEAERLMKLLWEEDRLLEGVMEDDYVPYL